MLVVVMIVALVSVVALTLLNYLQIDLSIVGQNRRATEARFLADAGNVELADHQATEAQLPDTNTYPDLVAPINPPNDSWVNRPNGDSDAAPETYTGQISFLRQVYIAESTLTVTRGNVFELAVTGQINGGDAASEVRSEVMKLTTLPLGSQLPRMHAR
jgi:hypothetical protein